MSFPTLVLRNQFGETSNNVMEGGTSLLSAVFKVASTDSAGKGITNLSAYGISNVFMHTAETPASGNPNPAAGLILVEFAEPFVSLKSLAANVFGTPDTGSNVNISAGLTIGKAYVISAVGTSTPANWQDVGLPVGITPAVGAVFIATSASAGTGTGTVQLMATAGTTANGLVLLGDPTKTSQPSAGSPYLILASMAAASVFTYDSGTPASSTVATAPALTALADGTFVNLSISVVPTPGPQI